MASSQITIHISKDADLAHVVEMITNASAKRIFLVLPENSHIAERILNFQILKRESEVAHKELIIVSADPRLQGLANKAGLQAHQMMEEFASGEGGVLSPTPELPQDDADEIGESLKTDSHNYVESSGEARSGYGHAEAGVMAKEEFLSEEKKETE